LKKDIYEFAFNLDFAFIFKDFFKLIE